MTPPLLTPPQVAARLSVSVGMVYKLAKGRALAVAKIGKAVRVTSDEVDRYIEKQTKKSIA